MTTFHENENEHEPMRKRVRTAYLQMKKVPVASIHNLEPSNSASLQEARIRTAVSQIQTSHKPIPASPDESCTIIGIPQHYEHDEGLKVYAGYVATNDFELNNIRNPLLLASNCLNAGQSHLDAKRYKTAMEYFESARCFLEKNAALTEASCLLACTYFQLGYCEHRSMNRASAIAYYKSALKLAKEKHLGTLVSAAALNCIGVMHFYEENCADALSALKESLALYRGSFATDFVPAIATVLNNIGRVLFLSSSFSEALPYYTKALGIREIQLGRNSFDFAVTLCNLGQCYQQLGDLEKAMSCYKDFLHVSPGTMAESHVDVAVVLNCIADIHCHNRQYDLAEAVLKRALKINQNFLGLCHPQVAICFNKLGNLFYACKRYEEALDSYRQALRIEDVVLDAKDPQSLVTMMKIAQTYRDQKAFGSALAYYADLHRKTTRIYGPQSLEAASTCSNIALMHHQMKNYDAALELYQQVLEKQREYYGSDLNNDIASTLNAIGLALFNKGDGRNAEKQFRRSLEVRIQLRGRNHRDVAVLWYNLATLTLENGDEDVALSYFMECLRVERVALGPNHPDVAMTLQHIGLVLQQQGKLAEACEFLTSALEIHGERRHRPLVRAKLLNLIGNIHLKLGRVSEMMEALTQACRLFEATDQTSGNLIVSGHTLYSMNKLHPPCAQVA